MKENIKIPIKQELGLSTAEKATSEAPLIRYVEFVNRHSELKDSYNYWYAYTDKGKKFSVVDVKSLFKSHDMQSMRDYFDYWEAMPIDNNGELSELIIRCKSMEELAQQICKI